MKSKKLLTLIISAACIATALPFAACGGKNDNNDTVNDSVSPEKVFDIENVLKEPTCGPFKQVTEEEWKATFSTSISSFSMWSGFVGVNDEGVDTKVFQMQKSDYVACAISQAYRYESGVGDEKSVTTYYDLCGRMPNGNQYFIYDYYGVEPATCPEEQAEWTYEITDIGYSGVGKPDKLAALLDDLCAFGEQGVKPEGYSDYIGWQDAYSVFTYNSQHNRYEVSNANLSPMYITERLDYLYLYFGDGCFAYECKCGVNEEKYVVYDINNTTPITDGIMAILDKQVKK